MSVGKYFAGAGLLVLPFIFGLAPGEDMRDPKVRALAILFGLWIGTELYRRVHPALGCAAIVMFISGALRSVQFPMHQVLGLTAAFGSCLWVAQLKKDDIKQGLEILEVSGVLVAFYALVLQLSGQDTILTYLPHFRPMGFFGQHTLYGPFAVACFASSLFHGRHFRALLLFLPIPIIDSSFTYLSLAVVLFLFTLRMWSKYAILGALLLSIVAGTVAYVHPKAFGAALDDQGRFKLWDYSILLGKRQMLLGHGLASFRIIYPIFANKELRAANGIDDEKQSDEMKKMFADTAFLTQISGQFLHPHNEPILAFFEFGLIGVAIGLWWVAAFALCWFLLPDEDWAWALGAIFFLFLANSLGSFPFHLIPQALLPLWAFVIVASRGILEADEHPTG